MDTDPDDMQRAMPTGTGALANSGQIGDSPIGISIGSPQPLPQPPSRLVHIRFPALGEKFAGRRLFLDALARDLQPGQATSLSPRAAIRAAGGVGKTALAVELGWQLYQQRAFAFVFFLNATSPEALDGDLAALCRRDLLNLPEQAAREPLLQLQGVLAWLKTPANARRTLLILDGADLPEAKARVRELLLLLPACALLITSRGVIGSGIRGHLLAPFTPEEARDFLRSRLDPIFFARLKTLAALDRIAEAVEHLPLALELAAGYMRQTRQSPREWLEEWSEVPTATWQQQHAKNTPYPISLSRLCEQNFHRLTIEAVGMLQVLAWIAPRPAALPLEPLQKSEFWQRWRESLVLLEKYSLIQWPAGTQEISMHRLLQVMLRQGQLHVNGKGALSVTRGLLEDGLPDPAWSEPGWQLWERLAPHLDAIVAHLRGSEDEDEAEGLLNQYALWLSNRAQHAQAEPLFRRVLAIAERSFGLEHPTVAIRLNNLASLLQASNRLVEAEPLFRRALAIDEKCLGMEHPTVAIRLNNLAGLLQAANRLAETEPLFRWALAIDEKSLGLEHPEVAIRLNNLAEMLQASNRLVEAEPLFRRALAIDEKCLGLEHPTVAIRLNNLASLLQAANRLLEAEPLFRRALAIDEKCLGMEHPTVAIRLNNLAEMLQASNRLLEAEPLFRRALEIFIQFTMRTGPRHPHLDQAFGNYAKLLKELGWDEAKIQQRLDEVVEEAKKPRE